MKVEIRAVGDRDRLDAWRILAELRTHLDPDDFEAGLAEQAQLHGYALVGAFEDGRLTGVMGFREVRTFARGRHLHVDDLVVASDARGQGIGRRLIEYAEALARERGLEQVFLDSRPGAVGFYERRGYRRHESTLIKKQLGEPET